MVTNRVKVADFFLFYNKHKKKSYISNVKSEFTQNNTLKRAISEKERVKTEAKKYTELRLRPDYDEQQITTSHIT